MEYSSNKPHRLKLPVIQKISSRIERIHSPAAISLVKQKRIYLQQRYDTIVLCNNTLGFGYGEILVIIVNCLEIIWDDPGRNFKRLRHFLSRARA